jgi:hypothetical protein
MRPVWALALSLRLCLCLCPLHPPPPQPLRSPRRLMSQQSILLTPSVQSVDGGLARWNDPTDPFDPDDPQQIDQTGVDTLKTDNVEHADKANHSSILESTHMDPSPMSGSPSASMRDSASTHSLPAVQVTEPQHSPSQPQGPDIPFLSEDDGSSLVQRSVGSSTTAAAPSQRRSVLSRPVFDVRRPCSMLFSRES